MLFLARAGQCTQWDSSQDRRISLRTAHKELCLREDGAATFAGVNDAHKKTYRQPAVAEVLHLDCKKDRAIWPRTSAEYLRPFALEPASDEAVQTSECYRVSLLCWPS